MISTCGSICIGCLLLLLRRRNLTIHVVSSRIIHPPNLLGVLRHVEISSELRIMWATFLKDGLGMKLLSLLEGLNVIELQATVHLHQ